MNLFLKQCRWNLFSYLVEIVINLKYITYVIRVLNYKFCQRKQWRKSTEPKPWLSCAVKQAKVNIRFDHTNSIIRPQAFIRLRPVSSWLGHISQSQPKNLQLSMKTLHGKSQRWRHWSIPANGCFIIARIHRLNNR